MLAVDGGAPSRAVALAEHEPERLARLGALDVDLHLRAPVLDDLHRGRGRTPADGTGCRDLRCRVAPPAPSVIGDPPACEPSTSRSTSMPVLTPGAVRTTWSPAVSVTVAIAELEVDGAARGGRGGVTVEPDAHRRAVDREQVGAARVGESRRQRGALHARDADLGERDRHHDRLSFVELGGGHRANPGDGHAHVVARERRERHRHALHRVLGRTGRRSPAGRRCATRRPRRSAAAWAPSGDRRRRPGGRDGRTSRAAACAPRPTAPAVGRTRCSTRWSDRRRTPTSRAPSRRRVGAATRAR